MSRMQGLRPSGTAWTPAVTSASSWPDWSFDGRPRVPLIDIDIDVDVGV